MRKIERVVVRMALVVGTMFACSAFGEVATAKWTGAGDRTNLSDPNNWECYDNVGDVVANAVPDPNKTVVAITGETDFTCPVGSPTLWLSLGISGTVTLKADCDWRGLGNVFGGFVAANTTINLKGHELFVKVPNGAPSKRINVTDDLAQGKGGRFHIDVAEGEAFENSQGWRKDVDNFWFSGTVEVVKDGKGRYRPTYANNTTGLRCYAHTGGTTIHEGLLDVSNDDEGTSSESYYAQVTRPMFGAYGSSITIEAAGTFDYRGIYDLAKYNLYMNGGTYTCSRKPSRPDWGSNGEIVFGADSFITVPRSAHMAGPFTLNGYTLTATVLKDQIWYMRNGKASNGTVKFEGEGIVQNYDSVLATDNATYDINCAFDMLQPMTVKNYIARYDGDGNSGTAAMTVTGRFTPLTRSFIPCTLSPNATLDLSTQTEAWSPTNQYGSVKFPRGTMTIDVGDRELADGEKIVVTASELEDFSVRIVGTKIQSTESGRIEADGIYYDIPQGTVISRATWTGAGRNNDFDDPANWICIGITGEIVSAVPTADTTVNFGMINFDLATREAVAKIASYKNVFFMEGSIALSRDCDWRGLSAFDPLFAGKVIELAGHTLQLTGLDGSTPYPFTVKDSSGADGKLVVDVPAGAVFENSAIKLEGSLQLIKTGEGTYVPRFYPQGYTNLTQIVAGMIKLYNVEEADSSAYALNTSKVPHTLGINGTPVRVEPNGTIDINGVYDMMNMPIILNGGILTNTKKQAQYEWGGLGNIVLEADSFLDLPVSTVFRSEVKPVNLNGHTLTVRMPEDDGSNSLDVRMYTRSTVYTNGILRITGMGILDINGSAMQATTATVDTDAGICLNGNLNVSNFVTRYAGVWTAGANSVHVYGSFSAPANQFPPVVMHEGAAFDVSARTADTPMPLVSLIGSVTYAADATNIVVDVGARTLTSGEKLLAWETLPEKIHFTLRGDNVPAEYTLMPTEMGLFYNPNIDSRIVLKATWTGAAGDNNLSNPANWTQCKNMFNMDVANGVPGGAAVVTLQGPVGFSVPLGASIPWQKVLFNSVVFTQDVDWRGLGGFFNYQNANAVLDLNGHKLFVRPPNGNPTSTCTVTDTSTNAEVPGELHLCQDAWTAFTNNKVTMSGNLRVVKEGAGTFSSAKFNQTYTGGNEIVAGNLQLYNPNAAGNTGYALGQGNKFALGPYNAKPIVVRAGSVYELNGVYDTSNYPLVLEGGEVLNGKAITQTTWGAIDHVTVKVDSSLRANDNTVINGNDIKLGGNTLEVRVGSGKNLYLRGGAQNGTFKFLSGGYATVASGNTFDARTVTFDVNCALNVAGTLNVSNYVARYTANYNLGAAVLAVYGTFTPVADKFYGCTLQDGSTLNLADKTGVWNVKAAYPAGDKNCTGLDTVTFAENARINVDLGEREFEFVDGLAQVIAWTAKPDSTVTFKSDSKALKGNRRFFITDEGLFVMRTSLTIFFR